MYRNLTQNGSHLSQGGFHLQATLFRCKVVLAIGFNQFNATAGDDDDFRFGFKKSEYEAKSARLRRRWAIAPSSKMPYSLKDVRMLVRITENWYDVILGLTGIKKRPVIRFRNGLKFMFVKGRFLTEVFSDNCYEALDARGRDVVDGGAFNGDSSLYFAMKGARHVYAYELVPKTFEVAKENIRLNRFKNVQIHCQAVSATNTVTKVDPNSPPSGSCKIERRLSGILVPVVSLESIVREFKLRDAALKLDCEGEEFPIVLDSPDETLKSFSEIMLEYHSDPKPLQQRLASLGYIITYPSTTTPNVLGILYARRD